MNFSFFHQFFVPQEFDLLTPGGDTYIHTYIMLFTGRCFPLLGLKLEFFGVDGGFPHTPGSTGSGHFWYTIFSCCKFGPLASLLDNGNGSQIHQSEDNILHNLNQPSSRLEPTIYQRPYSQTPLLLVFIQYCRYWCPHTDMYGHQALLLKVCQHPKA